MSALCALLTVLHSCAELFALRRIYRPPDTHATSHATSQASSQATSQSTSQSTSQATSQASSQATSQSTSESTSQSTSQSTSLVDLSSLYPGSGSSWSSPRRWNKLHQFVTEARHQQLQLCWVCDCVLRSTQPPTLSGTGIE